MELNIKFNEKMIVETANRVLDEYEYRGKTIREWADLIANPKTNADRIRTMSDEELAGFLYAVWRHEIGLNEKCVKDFAVPFYKWLKQEAKEDGER